ncbi:DUF3570 domain-containing protein [Hahella ganghwensis]|uniref:DUF3570 domain-containing protein n=1 Tax=Hahella ganghwensis TaxID=286420 RepID=UPI001FE00D37|nr:DUF3570 domain-containing protein [Hahella ganghwensis]
MGVTKVMDSSKVLKPLFLLVACLFVIQSLPAPAAVLPEQAVEVLYHRYDQDGQLIDGPAILVRKNFDSTFSLSGEYLVDSVSGASIDVESTASEYEEERIQTSVAMDYLTGKSILSVSYSNSEENDYESNALSFNVSQDVFGDLTTISMGYTKGWDEVGKVGDDNFSEELDRQQYRLGVTQILTKNAIINLDFEAITDEGFLNNAYRQVRFVSDSARGYDFQSEQYPTTRTSRAIAIRGMYYLPYRAAIRGEYRFFSDTWGIRADQYEIGYIHPAFDQWIFEFKYRYYSQTKADFYSDLFAFQNAQNFLARDKELSTFSNHTFGLGVTYEFQPSMISFIEKGQINLFVDYLKFEYEDFRDITQEGYDVGDEPFYEFDALVTRLFLKLEY